VGDAVRFQRGGEEFIVSRDSPLLSFAGLPAAVWRYAGEEVNEEEVARKFIRVRVVKPEQYQPTS
jgi:hypothetical protein